MSKKKNIINWILGMVLCTLGLCISTKSGLGLSMIGATPYIVHVFMSQYFPWFTQGVAEYVVEGLILVLTCLITLRFKWKYLLSFLVAILAGLMIDGWLFIFGGNSAYESLPIQILAFVLGAVITAIAIAFFFRTNLPLQVYELAVNAISERFHFKQSTVKYVYDFTTLAVDLILALVLTKGLTGIGVGTVILTIINAPLISFFGKIIDKVERNNLEKK